MMSNKLVRPFIAGFATPIGHAPLQTMRYDEHRQLSQVLINNVWIDAANTQVPEMGSTKTTKVFQETSDDD